MKKNWTEYYGCLTSTREIRLYVVNKGNVAKGGPKIIISINNGAIIQEITSTDPKTFVFQIEEKEKDKKGERKIHFFQSSNKSLISDWIIVCNNVLQGSKQNSNIVQIEERLRHMEYSINPTDLVLEEKILGKGASGTVKRGTWLGTTTVAVKVLNELPEFTNNEDIGEFYKEIEMLSKMRHPNIVSMYGYARKGNFVMLVTEFVTGGDLSSYLKDTSINPDFATKVASGLSICSGMVYLHSKGIIHRDLKPGNILVENAKESKFKVCDFGLSGFFQKAEKKKESTPNYF